MVVYNTPQEQAQAVAAAKARGDTPASQWFGAGGGLEQAQASGAVAGYIPPTAEGQTRTINEQAAFYQDVAGKAYPNDVVEQKKYYNYLVEYQLPGDISRKGITPTPEQQANIVSQLTSGTQVTEAERLRALSETALKSRTESGPQESRILAARELARRNVLAPLDEPGTQTVLTPGGEVRVYRQEPSGPEYKTVGMLGSDIPLADLAGRNVGALVDIARVDKTTGETLPMGSMPLGMALSTIARSEKTPLPGDYIGDYVIGTGEVGLVGGKIKGSVAASSGYEYTLTGQLPPGVEVKDTTLFKDTLKVTYASSPELAAYLEAKAAYEVTRANIDTSPVDFTVGYVSTLLSGRGAELFGESARAIATGRGDLSGIIARSALETRATSKAAEVMGFGAASSFVSGVYGATPIPFVKEGSPIVEIETTLLGSLVFGKAIGLATQAAKGTGLAATAGKAAISLPAQFVYAGAGGAMLGPRLADIYLSQKYGDSSRALGLAITTIADVGVGYYGYKAGYEGVVGKPYKGPAIYEVKKTEALFKVEDTGTVTIGNTKGNIIAGEPQVQTTGARYGEFTAKDISGLTKAGYQAKYSATIVQEETVAIGGYYKTTGAGTSQPSIIEGVNIAGTPARDFVPGTSRFILREVFTGRIAKVGVESTILNRVGIKLGFIEKFPISDASTPFVGVGRQSVQTGVFVSKGETVGGYIYGQKGDILIPFRFKVETGGIAPTETGGGFKVSYIPGKEPGPMRPFTAVESAGEGMALATVSSTASAPRTTARPGGVITDITIRGLEPSSYQTVTTLYGPLERQRQSTRRVPDVYYSPAQARGLDINPYAGLERASAPNIKLDIGTKPKFDIDVGQTPKQDITFKQDIAQTPSFKFEFPGPSGFDMGPLKIIESPSVPIIPGFPGGSESTQTTRRKKGRRARWVTNPIPNIRSLI